MIHTTHQRPEGVYHRFELSSGVVWVVVYPDGRGVASFAVYEESVALAAIPLKDAEAHVTPEALAARNRFGTGAMLRVLRTVRESMPEILRWAYERKSGAGVGRRSVRLT